MTAMAGFAEDADPTARSNSRKLNAGDPGALGSQQGARPVIPGPGRPQLLFFYSRTSGASRRVEACLANVLQRHRNHSTFQLIRIAVEEYERLAEHFGIDELPTLVVVENRETKVRIEAPRGSASIETGLSPWLVGPSAATSSTSR